MQLNRECLKWERMVLKGEKLTLFFIWVSQFTCNWYIDYQLSKGNKTDWILEQSEVTQNGLYMNPSLILKSLIFQILFDYVEKTYIAYMEGNDSFEDYDEQLSNHLSKIEGLGSLKLLMSFSVGYLYTYLYWFCIEFMNTWIS